MNIHLPARQLLEAMKGFKPHAKGRAFQQEYVHATAGGGMLILVGSYENSVSLAADVKSPGSIYLPLESTLRLLKSYKGKELIQLRSDHEALWLGTVKLPLRTQESKPKPSRAAATKLAQPPEPALPGFDRVITREQARKIATDEARNAGIGCRIDAVFTSEELKDRHFNLYGVDLANRWIAFVEQSQPMRLDSSVIVVIDQVRGTVVYAGPAHDEG